MNLDNLQLRKCEIGDLDILFGYQADKTYDQMAAFTSKNPTDKEAYFSKWTKLIAEKGADIQSIVLDGIVVGSISYFDLEGETNVTYGIGKAFWGKGIATKALQLFLKMLPQRPLYGRVAFDNVGSKKVLEKCGFQLIGTDHFFANARGKEIEEFILRLDS